MGPGIMEKKKMFSLYWNPCSEAKIVIFHWLPLAITLTAFLIPVVKLILSRKLMKVRWKLLGSEMNTWIWNTLSISEKLFEQKVKCTVGCNIIHLLQLLEKQLGFWQPFVDKDPIPRWHQITVDSKDSLNKILRLQPLESSTSTCPQNLFLSQ